MQRVFDSIERRLSPFPCAVVFGQDHHKHSLGANLDSQITQSELSGLQVTLTGGAEHPAKIVGYDEDRDVAVLQLITTEGDPVGSLLHRTCFSCQLLTCKHRCLAAFHLSNDMLYCLLPHSLSYQLVHARCLVGHSPATVTLHSRLNDELAAGLVL